MAIAVFVKGDKQIGAAKAWHADLWGIRETEDKQGGKYPWLFEHDLGNTSWKEIHPQSPLYLFKPRIDDVAGEYDSGWSLPKVMLSNNMGITTGVDSFATDFGYDELKNRVLELAGKQDDSTLREKYGLEDTSSFSLSNARKWAKLEKALASVMPIGYRCFDSRFVIYSSSVLARSREDICHHLIVGKNQTLITFRAIRKPPWVHVFVSDRIATKEYLSTLDNSYLFPLYLYPTKAKNTQQAQLAVQVTTWPTGKNGRTPNLAPEFIADLENRLGMKFVSDGTGDLKKTFGPEDVFNYIYAIFHSPTYRTRYAEFLKSDFPRIPLTSDVHLFRSLCGFGADLVALHLLESPTLQNPIVRYPIKGSDLVENGFPKYIAPGEPEPGTGKPLKQGRVYINKDVGAAVNDLRPPLSPLLNEEGKREARGGCAEEQGQCFEGVPPEVWNFHIGGYQVCHKWLKDRRGRKLSYDDQEHYCKVVTAVQETIRLMAEIDAAIPKWPIE